MQRDAAGYRGIQRDTIKIYSRARVPWSLGWGPVNVHYKRSDLRRPFTYLLDVEFNISLGRKGPSPRTGHEEGPSIGGPGPGQCAAGVGAGVGAGARARATCAHGNGGGREPPRSPGRLVGRAKPPPQGGGVRGGLGRGCSEGQAVNATPRRSHPLCRCQQTVPANHASVRLM